MYISHHALQQLKRTQELLNRLHPDADPLALTLPGSPSPQGDVIVFTGSFNPPTVAHLALLKQAQQFAHTLGNIRLYAAFSKRTIDKERVERPLLLDRIILLDHILKTRLPNTGILLFNRGLYVEQAQALRASFPRVRRIFFLMGFDKIVQTLDPRYYANRDAALAELFALAELLVSPRGDAGELELDQLLHEPQNQQYVRFIHLMPFNPAYREVSSTHIRQTNGLDTSDVPPEVRRFMARTGAYALPVRRPDGSLLDSYQERVACLRRVLRGLLS